jgi:hypothetical protein
MTKGLRSKQKNQETGMPTSLFSNLVLYVKNEIDALLATKSDAAHAHAHSDLSGVSADQHHAQLHHSAHATGAGDALAAADIGAATSSHQHARISCRVTCSGHPSIPNITGTPIPWDSEQWDTDAMHDNVVNNTRLTCSTAGLYLVIGNISFITNATGFRTCSLKKNGTTLVCWNGQNAIVGDSTYGSIVGLVDLSVGDYVEVYAYQNSGGTLTLVGTGSWFQAVRLAP